MEDKKISEAVELLYKGAKMLSYYCPECKVPLFKYKDRIFCPSCKRDVVFEKDVNNKKSNGKECKDESKTFSKAPPNRRDFEQKRNNIEDILRNALINLALRLESVEDLQNMKEVVELIEKLVEIIEKLKRMEYI